MFLDPSIEVKTRKLRLFLYPEELCLHKCLFKKKKSEIKRAILLSALQPPFKSGSCPSQIHIFIRTLWTAEQGPHIGKRREQQNAQIFNTWHRGCFMSFSVFGRCVCRGRSAPFTLSSPLFLQNKAKFSKFFTPARGSSSYLSTPCSTTRARF